MTDPTTTAEVKRRQQDRTDTLRAAYHDAIEADCARGLQRCHEFPRIECGDNMTSAAQLKRLAEYRDNWIAKHDEKQRALAAAQARLKCCYGRIGGLNAELLDWRESCADHAKAFARAREELAAESARVGDLQTQLDAINAALLNTDAIRTAPDAPSCIRALDESFHRAYSAQIAAEVRVRNLESALNGEPKVGKRRKQVMRALGMNTSTATEHEPTWDTLLEKVAQLATSGAGEATAARGPTSATETTVRCGAAEWLDDHCSAGWECIQSVVPNNGWYAHNVGTGQRTTYCYTSRLAREALARLLGWTPGEKAPPSTEAAPGRAEAPPVVSPDPGTGQGVLGAATGQQSGTATAEHKTLTWEECGAQCDACRHIPATCAGKDLRLEVDCPHFEKADRSPCGDPWDTLPKACQSCTADHQPCSDPPIDPCPLPAVGSWTWRDRSINDYTGYQARQADCSLWAHKDRKYGWSWSANICMSEAEPGDVIDCTGVSPTRKGAMRAAEKAARRAWRIRAGSRP